MADESKDGAGETSVDARKDHTEVVRDWVARLRTNLYRSVLPFWLSHSFDARHGGFWDCLAKDGSVYDDTKHVWLQGRQVWTYCRVYNTLAAEGKDVEGGGAVTRQALLEQAGAGMRFLSSHATATDGTVYFALTTDGKPAAVQRKIFSACFLAMALSEYAKALATSGDAAAATAHQAEAKRVIDKVLRWAEDPTALGRPQLEGARKLAPLAVPMMLLCVVKDYLRGRPEEAAGGKYDAVIARCVADIRSHVHADKELVLENVGPSGEFVDCIEGRQLNPGHAIECGWFMLEHAQEVGDEALRDLSLQIIDWSFERGWDKEHGGIFYFLDAAGHCPVPLEWNMKLWWPHCEAMIAYALAYRTTRKPSHLHKFSRVAQYTFDHFVDDADGAAGEWFGYLDTTGKVTHTFKGGPYKGCFHVPRALFMCVSILQSVLDDVATTAASSPGGAAGHADPDAEGSAGSA